MTAPPPSPPKRNSGRTGRRRMSETEAVFRGPKALYDHRRNHGRPIGAGNPMPPAPAWFTAPMRTIWDDVLATAPPGVLHQADYANLVVLVRAIHAHNTLAAAWLAYQTAEPPMLPPAELERRVRLAGAEVNRASTVLGLTAGRHLPGAPAEPAPAEANPHLAFRVIRPI
jgi:hypothetical protein